MWTHFTTSDLRTSGTYMQRVGQGTGTGLTLTGSLHHLFYVQDESCHNTWRDKTLCGILPLLELGGKCVWLDVLGTGVIREGEIEIGLSQSLELIYFKFLCSVQTKQGTLALDSQYHSFFLQWIVTGRRRHGNGVYDWLLIVGTEWPRPLRPKHTPLAFKVLKN